ncbi:MAG TPA: hypothetical protein VK961_02165 [Chthoniobacter sp.]|nr:hypothetical protein [Chthoniobacter sp.]
MNQARQFFWQAFQKLGLTKPKKHRFQRIVETYLERWKKFPGAPKKSAPAGGVGVVVMPWLQTAVPLYSLECARALAAKGIPVTILWDSTNLFGCAANEWEVSQLARAIDAARAEFEVVDVASVTDNSPGASEFLAELLVENSVQKLRGEKGVTNLLAENPALESEMGAHANKVRGLLRRRAFDWLLLPGGVWAVSGVYARVAAELGLSITTYDSGPGSLFVGHNGAAAHFCDVPGTTNAVLEQTADDAAERERMCGIAQRQIEIRMRGDDAYRLQPVASSASAKHRWDIIVPLNLRWDSAALCRQHLFANVGDWLSQLLAWVEKHPTATVAIRQHPCEKLVDFRGTDDFSKLLANYPGLGERAIYFSAQDEVNTYDLIAGSKVVLPFTSRVGIEAAMLGKPVILAANCYYKPCGFTWNPDSTAAYFNSIAQALSGDLQVSDAARERAAVTYYLTECCLELKTSFTPAPPDYEKWVQDPPEKIWNEPANQDLLTSLVSRVPLIQLRYRRVAGAAPAVAK